MILSTDRYYNQTKGLCGNYNSDKSDDLIAKSGFCRFIYYCGIFLNFGIYVTVFYTGERIVGSVHLVAKSWKELDIGEICSDTEILDEDHSVCVSSEVFQNAIINNYVPTNLSGPQIYKYLYE